MQHAPQPSQEPGKAAPRHSAEGGTVLGQAEQTLKVVPMTLPAYPSGLRRSEVAALAAALILHGGLLLALISSVDGSMVGAGGTELDAINVEIVAASEVLEALHAATNARPEAAGAKLAEVDPNRAARIVSSQRKAEAETAPAAPDAVVRELAQNAAPTERVEQAAPRNTTQSTGSETSEPSAPANGQAAVADAASAPAAALPGAASEYTKAVLVTLARRKPKGNAGAYGTVKIGFTIAASGEVRTAHVARSSGKTVLDDAALSAVRLARFPALPAELGASELAYVIPYIFR